MDFHLSIALDIGTFSFFLNSEYSKVNYPLIKHIFTRLGG